MSLHLKAICCCVVAAALVAVLIPAVAGANDPPTSMYSPRQMEMNSRQMEFFREEKEDGVQTGEPLTPNSGSICRRAGYVDPDVPLGVEEIGTDWTLKMTNWYSFTGTGGPVLIRLDGDWFYGAVLYQAEGLPTAAQGLACIRWYSSMRPRIELDTEAGLRYLIQVGDWKYFGLEVFGARYVLNVATPAPNRYRSHAIELPLGTPVKMSNFGGELSSPAPSCSTSVRTYAGGRSAWGKVSIPSKGSLRVALEPEDVDPGSFAMIELYQEDGDTPLACSVGPFNAAGNLTTELNAPISPGRYSLRLMTAVKSDENPAESMEERWRVTASFTPNLDVDGDGHFRPSDCRDDNAAIHPGAIDLPDDGIDEDCDGQDARRDSDGDGVPDYKDRCSLRSSKGIDKDGDGCRDPRQLPLTAQIWLALSHSKLKVSSLLVRTDPGARVVLECGNRACKGESKRMRGDRAQFGGSFRDYIPDGTEILIGVTKARHIGVVKRYRLSSVGMRLLRQWCTGPGNRGKTVACE